MSLAVEKKEKYTLVTIDVEKFDGTVSPDTKSRLVTVNREGEKNIIIDLSKVKYCDSSGLSAVLVGNRLCRDASGTFVICGLQPTVMKLITISQLDSILNITNTLSEAEYFLFMTEIENNINNKNQ